MNFYISKLEELSSEVGQSINETRDHRLEMHTMFSQDEVNELLSNLREQIDDAMCAALRKDVHQMATFLNTLYLQVEGQSSTLRIDPHILDDHKLLTVIENMIEKEKNEEGARATTDDSLMNDAKLLEQINALKEQNRGLVNRTAAIQAQYLATQEKNDGLSTETKVLQGKLEAVQSDIKSLNAQSAAAVQEEIAAINKAIVDKTAEHRALTKVISFPDSITPTHASCLYDLSSIISNWKARFTGVCSSSR